MKLYPSLTPSLQSWALSQPLFSTASAPLHGAHVNLSPKGLPATTFTVFDATHAAYIDATGSGAETIAHVYENGRVTVMFCSFGATPRILRLFCRGSVVEWDQVGFAEVLARMGKKVGDVVGARAVVLLEIFQVQTSCGYAVPLLAQKTISSTPSPSSPDGEPSPAAADDNAAEQGGTVAYLEDRHTLGHFAKQKVAKGEMTAYQRDNNARSMDGLPGLRRARRDRGEVLWVGEALAWARRVLQQRDALLVGVVLGVMLVLGARWVEALVVRLMAGGMGVGVEVGVYREGRRRGLNGGLSFGKEFRIEELFGKRLGSTSSEELSTTSHRPGPPSRDLEQVIRILTGQEKREGTNIPSEPSIAHGSTILETSHFPPERP